jgi:hypothetical protein
MKVICISVEDPTISNHCYGFITIGKWYDVLGEGITISLTLDWKHYEIINDHNDLVKYPQQCFKSLSSVREEKLNDLGI